MLRHRSQQTEAPVGRVCSSAHYTTKDTLERVWVWDCVSVCVRESVCEWAWGSACERKSVCKCEREFVSEGMHEKECVCARERACATLRSLSSRLKLQSSNSSYLIKCVSCSVHIQSETNITHQFCLCKRVLNSVYLMYLNVCEFSLSLHKHLAELCVCSDVVSAHHQTERTCLFWFQPLSSCSTDNPYCSSQTRTCTTESELNDPDWIHFISDELYTVFEELLNLNLSHIWGSLIIVFPVWSCFETICTV